MWRRLWRPERNINDIFPVHTSRLAELEANAVLITEQMQSGNFPQSAIRMQEDIRAELVELRKLLQLAAYHYQRRWNFWQWLVLSLFGLLLSLATYYAGGIR